MTLVLTLLPANLCLFCRSNHAPSKVLVAAEEEACDDDVNPETLDEARLMADDS